MSRTTPVIEVPGVGRGPVRDADEGHTDAACFLGRDAGHCHGESVEDEVLDPGDHIGWEVLLAGFGLVCGELFGEGLLPFRRE